MRFGSEARRIVVAAERLAAQSGEDVVTPEHLLLALGSASTTPGGRALASADFDSADIEEALARDRRALLASVGVTISDEPARSLTSRSRQPRFAPATKGALEQARRVAVERGDRRIGSEHLLLGLIRGDRTRIRRMLWREGIDVEELVLGLARGRAG